MNSSIFVKIKAVLQNEPQYRYKQVVSAIIHNGIRNFQDITTIPKQLREKLVSEVGEFPVLSQIAMQKSTLTEKYLFELSDGNRIEAVMMHHTGKSSKWSSLCLSSQVGCAMRCKFCATGQIGFIRNLTIDEILLQILHFYPNNSPKNLLFMGMGEPLLNPNVFKAIEILTSPEYFNIGERHISLSTIGIPEKIAEFTKHFPQINLSYSLHTPFENQRKELTPYGSKFSIESTLQVLDQHIAHNRRKVFIAYVLMNAVNDTIKHATALVKLLKSRGKYTYLYHVNLIRYNQINTPDISPSTLKATESFCKYLKNHGINATIRRTFGEEISAACGQLRAKYEDKT